MIIFNFKKINKSFKLQGTLNKTQVGKSPPGKVKKITNMVSVAERSLM